MPIAARSARRTWAALAIGGILAVALGLASMVGPVNLERGCVVDDTPYFEFCGDRPTPGTSGYVAWLRDLLRRNPGDAATLVKLAHFAGAEERERWLRAAVVLAPNEPNILAQRAIGHLEREEWAEAAGPLIQLAESQNDPRMAAAGLARIVLAGHGELLHPHLRAGSRWLPVVLDALRREKWASSRALSLVAAAIGRNAIDYDIARAYIRDLKAAGAWTDAYSLWVALNGGKVAILYNPGFEQAFQPDGFDWELPDVAPSRTGALFSRPRAEGHGAVLEFEYNGRPIPQPQVWQRIFLSPGHYRVKGRYMAQKLRLEGGLIWRLQCGSEHVVQGESGSLTDTRGEWRDFSFDFDFPATCGTTGSLQLETRSAAMALSGGWGRAQFDDFSLERVPLH